MEFCFSGAPGRVRAKRPLVCILTNSVTINDCANVCICAGGSPVMTDSGDDALDLVSAADSLVLNIGTANDRTLGIMLEAGKAAKNRGIPVVFDPVGAGASRFRNEVACRIIKDVSPDIIKGNNGEMMFLSGTSGFVRGVDSDASFANVYGSVRKIADGLGCIAASTGVTDYVSDGKKTVVLANGHCMEAEISGTGCMLSAVIGAYSGAFGASLDTVVSAITSFNIAAEKAAEISRGPGTFRQNLMDSLYGLSEEDISSRICISE